MKKLEFHELHNQTVIFNKIIAKQAEINELIAQLQALNPELTPTQKKPSKRFEIPSIGEIKEHIDAMGYFVDAEQFHAFYSSKDWMIGKNKMKNWRAALVTWNKRAVEKHPGGTKPKNGNPANWSDQKMSFMDSMMSEDF